MLIMLLLLAAEDFSLLLSFLLRAGRLAQYEASLSARFSFFAFYKGV